jgi:heat shock protein HslJ
VSATAAVIDRIFSGHTVHEQVDGTTLTIKGDGAGALVYQWVPADAQATDPANLTGRTWHLTSVAGEPAAGTVDLRVDRGGAFASSDGCNELNGIAQVGQGSLSVNMGARTQVGCTQAETIESFLNQKPALWSIRDGKLLIYGGGAQAFALVYEADAPPPAVPSAAPNAGQLVGPTWALSSIETRSAGSDSKEASSDYGITLTFAKNGTFALHTKCTGSAGTATVHGSTVQFANVHGTGGNFCLSPQATQSRKVLDGTVKWKVDSDGLHLTKGGTTLTFEG